MSARLLDPFVTANSPAGDNPYWLTLDLRTIQVLLGDDVLVSGADDRPYVDPGVLATIYVGDWSEAAPGTAPGGIAWPVGSPGLPSDTTGDGTVNKPYATLARALRGIGLDRGTPGARIQLGVGTFELPGTLLAANNITITGLVTAASPRDVLVVNGNTVDTGLDLDFDQALAAGDLLYWTTGAAMGRYSWVRTTDGVRAWVGHDTTQDDPPAVAFADSAMLVTYHTVLTGPVAGVTVLGSVALALTNVDIAVPLAVASSTVTLTRCKLDALTCTRGLVYAYGCWIEDLSVRTGEVGLRLGTTVSSGGTPVMLEQDARLTLLGEVALQDSAISAWSSWVQSESGNNILRLCNSADGVRFNNEGESVASVGPPSPARGGGGVLPIAYGYGPDPGVAAYCWVRATNGARVVVQNDDVPTTTDPGAVTAADVDPPTPYEAAPDGTRVTGGPNEGWQSIETLFGYENSASSLSPEPQIRIAPDGNVEMRGVLAAADALTSFTLTEKWRPSASKAFPIGVVGVPGMYAARLSVSATGEVTASSGAVQIDLSSVRFVPELLES